MFSVERVGVVDRRIKVVAVMRRWRPDGINPSGTEELGVHAAEHHNAQLVGDSLRYIEPELQTHQQDALLPQYMSSLSPMSLCFSM